MALDIKSSKSSEKEDSYNELRSLIDNYNVEFLKNKSKRYSYDFLEEKDYIESIDNKNQANNFNDKISIRKRNFKIDFEIKNNSLPKNIYKQKLKMMLQKSTNQI